MGTVDDLKVYDTLRIGGISTDFIGKGNIWINNCYDGLEISLAQYIIYNALANTAPGQLSVIGFDNDLSGVLAPFSALATGELKRFEIISDVKTFEERLGYLRQHIQAVQNVIQGRSKSLLEFRKTAKITVEEYKLVVLCLDMGMIEQKFREKLSLLMRSGVAAGVSFLIISPTDMVIHTSSGSDITLSVGAIASNITVLNVNGNVVSTEGENKSSYEFPGCRKIMDYCDKFVNSIKNVELPTVCFDELHDLGSFWKDSSAEGLTFCVGKYGTSSMSITIGDEIEQRHNILITGAVGQGKSNLISVIIHSLCLRYSPQELELYMLDFKEGVTFKAFTNVDRDEFLPHAKTVGLESDVELGIAMLNSLYSEYQRRMRVMKNKNARSIRELRLNNPDITMPRIVVIIDEFQMMFSEDMQVGLTVAALLEKSVRLFRAAGIHFILASQTLSGNMALVQKQESIFSQVPIRIALKNSDSESKKSLSFNNSAAAFLKPREAIVNLDYGDVSQNRKTIVAYADEKLLVPVRREWWEKSRSEVRPPYVFDSERRITVSSGIEKIKAFRRNSTVPRALIGNLISIKEESIALPMSAEPGRNIAIIGTPDGDCNHAVGIMQSIAISLAWQHKSGKARFIFCDFGEIPKSREFEWIMETAGYYIESVSAVEFDNKIQSLIDQPGTDDKVYVFGLSMDRWRYEKDPYGQGTVLKTLVENCPMKNIHFIGWWVKASAFTAQTAGYGYSESFNTKIFLRLDEKSVQSLTNSLVRWHPQENRALLSDTVELAEEITFIPYSPVSSSDQNTFKTQIWT